MLVSALPQRPGDPWINQQDVADAGTPQAVLDALNPQLSRNLVSTVVEQHDDKSYYTYELNNTATKFANRRLIKVAPIIRIALSSHCMGAHWMARGGPSSNRRVAGFGATPSTSTTTYKRRLYVTKWLACLPPPPHSAESKSH